MIQKDIDFITNAKRKNKRIVAQYLALYTECSHLKKCLVTFTPADGRLSTLIEIRQDFFKLLNRYKRNKKDGDLTIKYFSNIEFTKTSQPHIHIQLFFTNKAPIIKVFESVVCIEYDNTHTNSLSFANDNSKIFTYTIKNYLNFDLQLEKLKYHFKDLKYITSSQKSISNTMVKYLFRTVKFKTKNNRYKEILNHISNGTIVIKDNKCIIDDSIKLDTKNKIHKNKKVKRSKEHLYKIKDKIRRYKRKYKSSKKVIVIRKKPRFFEHT
ncbi:MAG: hypothetical protein HN887_06875 [Campylobacteraceae bacterium]|jgi:hypothetical protein|nr:hypothetical protein [bacterium]MBT7274713.1 hypothetical protein [Campylobacteraceae bacterium]